MSLQQLIDGYGYLAIVIGTFLEGETTLILGAIAAKLGYLELPWVIVCAFVGSVIGDQLFFLLGRFHGTAFLQRHTSWQARAAKVDHMLQQHRILIVLGCRFLYGLRIVSPFVIGMSGISLIEFVVLNLLGAACWAVLFGTLGFAFGQAMELLLGDIRHYELEILGSVVVISAVVWLAYLLPKRKRKKPR